MRLSSSGIMENLKDPRYVIEQANRLHAALQPNVADYQRIIGHIDASKKLKTIRERTRNI
jgi:hypothetical protein